MKKSVLLSVLSFLLPFSMFAQPMISRFAGGGTGGDGGAASLASLSAVQGICTDGYGNIYVLETGRVKVRKINRLGIISTVAGNGSSGYTGDGGAATAAPINGYGINCNEVGDLLIGDWSNGRIRRVDAATGIITTVAGGGTGGDGSAATSAVLYQPISAAYDLVGNIYISEYGTGRIRKVSASTGLISTVVSGLGSPSEINIDASGIIYVADRSRNLIYKITSSGTVTTVAGGGISSGSGVAATSLRLSAPEGVAVDCENSVFLTDYGSSVIRKVNTSGISTTVAGGGSTAVSYTAIAATSASIIPQWLTIDVFGNVFFTDGGSYIYKVTGISPGSGRVSPLYPRSICLPDTISFGRIGGTWTASDTAIIAVDSSTGSIVGRSAGVATVSYTLGGCAVMTAEISVLDYCSGVPSAGSVVYRAGTTCGSPDTFSLAGATYACGITWQWQQSFDGSTWSDIAGATDRVFTSFHYISTHYFRCKLTCTSSGYTATTSNYTVSGASSAGLTAAYVRISSDCAVDGQFIQQTCALPTHYFHVVTAFGDGTSEDHNLTFTSGHLPSAMFTHTYTTPGVYSISQSLYDSSTFLETRTQSINYGYCSTLPIRFYIDRDSNCAFDSNDRYLSVPISVEIDSNGHIIDTISVTSGLNYHAFGPVGTVYKFRFIHDTLWTTCPVSSTIIDTIQSGSISYPTKYMAVKPDTLRYYNLDLHVVMDGTGSHFQSGTIYVQNLFGRSADADVKLQFDSRLTSVGSVNTRPRSIFGNTVIWSLTGVSSFADRPQSIDFYANHRLTLGSIISNYFCDITAGGDIDTTNDNEQRDDTAKSGFDPNYIQANPSACIDTNLADKTIEYTIHFENTGNAPAHNIHVLDTLSPYLDPRTIKVKLASATMNLSLVNDRGYNVLKFDFPNIELLDSSHHGQCDGAVIYTIKPNQHLPYGTSILNRAGIYFDANDVVLTNTSNTMIGCASLKTTSVENTSSVTVFPNPFSNSITLKAQKDVWSSYEVYNLVGQKMAAASITQNETDLNLEGLSEGIYLVYVTAKDGSRETIKIIKK